jgi:3-oxoacyl-[acyl-carrier protein] reductase
VPRLSQLSRSIAGRTAIITGAASGMGRATAHLFADEGARVAVVDLDREGAAAVAKEIEAAGGSARSFGIDVGDRDALAGMVEQTRATLGPIDILVNNAGAPRGGPVEADGFLDQWDESLRVNLTAQVVLIRLCLADLERAAAGRVVNIASTEGLGGQRFSSPYTAAKTGVVGLTRALAVELGARGVTVNCVCPGPIRTGMTAGIPEEDKAIFAKRKVPLRRYGEPEEVAHATLSLVLPAASYQNGVVLPVDGGMTIKND